MDWLINNQAKSEFGIDVQWLYFLCVLFSHFLSSQFQCGSQSPIFNAEVLRQNVKVVNILGSWNSFLIGFWYPFQDNFGDDGVATGLGYSRNIALLGLEILFTEHL